MGGSASAMCPVFRCHHVSVKAERDKTGMELGNCPLHGREGRQKATKPEEDRKR